MKHDAETQVPIIAKRDAGRLADNLRQGFQFAAENFGYVLAWVSEGGSGI